MNENHAFKSRRIHEGTVRTFEDIYAKQVAGRQNGSQFYK